MKENEVLADFIGKRRDNPSKGYEQQWELPMCEGYYPSASKLEFDKRWERLIPVWYKFKELKFSYGNDEANHEQLCDAIEDAILHKGPSPEEACKRLSEAIEWYNANK